MRNITRNLLISGAAIAVAAAVTVTLVSLAGIGLVDKAFLGLILICIFLFNCYALTIVLRAAFRRDDHVMDLEAQSYILRTFSTAMFAVIGANNIYQFLQPGVGLVFLVMGVIILGGTPFLFLWDYYRLARAEGKMREAD